MLQRTDPYWDLPISGLYPTISPWIHHCCRFSNFNWQMLSSLFGSDTRLDFFASVIPKVPLIVAACSVMERYREWIQLCVVTKVLRTTVYSLHTRFTNPCIELALSKTRLIFLLKRVSYDPQVADNKTNIVYVPRTKSANSNSSTYDVSFHTDNFLPEPLTSQLVPQTAFYPKKLASSNKAVVLGIHH